MRRLGFLLAVFLALGTASVWADSLPNVVTNVDRQVWTVTVYNNSSSSISSNNVVVWDTSSTNLTTNGYRYITTSTTADDIWTAGVMDTPSCAASSLCEITVFGPHLVVCDDSSDAVGINTTVGTTTGTAGRCGDYVPAANKRSLGTALQAGDAVDNNLIMIFVNTLGAPAEQ